MNIVIDSNVLRCSCKKLKNRTRPHARVTLMRYQQIGIPCINMVKPKTLDQTSQSRGKTTLSLTCAKVIDKYGKRERITNRQTNRQVNYQTNWQINY